MTHVIAQWWQRQPGKFACLATRSPTGWEDHFFERGEIDSIAGFVADHLDHDIYFCPHSFTAPCRRKVHAALPIGALWADLDHVDPRDLGELRPTIALRTSPGRYAGLWKTDAPASEELNRRLAYHVGADKGGWCLTKVLRCPGSLNWKYDPPARVRVLWDDGPVHRVAQLERLLPQVEQPQHADIERKASPLTMAEIIAKRGVTGWLRRRLEDQGQLHKERRHRLHWRLACELHELGVPAHEAFVLLAGCAWNKHGNDIKPLWDMVAKVWSRASC